MRGFVDQVRHYISASPAGQSGEHVTAQPPVGSVFGTFALTLVALATLTIAESAYEPVIPQSGLDALGVVATTVFSLAALSIAYRAARTTTASLIPIAAAFALAGGWWCWELFVALPSAGRIPAVLAGLVWTALALLLLTERRHGVRWLGMFSGLASAALAFSAVLVLIAPASTANASTAILIGMAAMTALYGCLVDIEAAELRSLDELMAAKQRVEDEIARTEELLHDLRSGLLSIEAAIGTVDSDLAGPLGQEAARLRRLTSRGKRSLVDFDIVPGVFRLATARRAAGIALDVRAPTAARVFGEESELLAIVDNLVANAHRHTDTTTIIEIDLTADEVVVAVIDDGLADDLDPSQIFERGYSSSPTRDGIGLARCKMLAEANNGDLSLQPGPDGHTRFALTLSRSDAFEAGSGDGSVGSERDLATTPAGLQLG